MMDESTNDRAREQARETESEIDLWRREFTEDHELYELSIWAN